ncbi:EF-Tu/IF-2/RF-3 family GTPase [Pseudactinotalea sp.]|uniref:EF-Tu/IF-2/RF-3 family GTPase n=1 Tax=Pseudactinotalea sp. TaxID=1926260 RepID=UPI003B3B5C4F
MTFFPDGETNIPHQTPVPETRSGQVPPGRPQPSAYDEPGGPERPSGSSSQADPAFTTAIVRTAMINGVVLVVALLLAYVFPITEDPTVATAIVVVAALFAGVHLFVVLRSQQRRRAQERGAGVQPAGSFGPAPAAEPQPYGVMPATGAFTMTVEDIFTITGRGTVVTGRIDSGELHTGQTVVVQRGGAMLAEVEVTGIEMFRKMSDVARAGENVGLLLAGIGRDELQRGDVLTR